MKVKTSELEGAALDWAVAKAASVDVYANPHWGPVTKDGCSPYRPSTDWSQGGPLIDRYLIEFRTQAKGCKVLAWAAHEPRPSEGPSHLVAACRAVVKIEIGDTIDVPDELMEGER